MSKAEFLIIMCTSTHTASFSAYELLYSICFSVYELLYSSCCSVYDVAPPPYGRLPPPPLSGAPGQTKATLLPFPKTSPYYIITSCIAPITIGNHLPSFWDEGFGLGPITAFKRCWGSPYIEVWQVQWQLGRGYHTTTSRCWSKPIVPRLLTFSRLPMLGLGAALILALVRLGFRWS